MAGEGEKPDENGRWRCIQMKPERGSQKGQARKNRIDTSNSLIH